MSQAPFDIKSRLDQVFREKKAEIDNITIPQNIPIPFFAQNLFIQGTPVPGRTGPKFSTGNSRYSGAPKPFLPPST